MLFSKKGKYCSYIAITPNEVYQADSVEELNKEMDGLLGNSEFKRVGDCYIATMNNEDLTFIQDKKRMANIPWQRLAKKDKTVEYILYGVLVLQFITLIKA